MILKQPFFWTSASRTDVGKVRRHNEDACLDLPGCGLWAVADGMGGHDSGEVASAAIVETLAGIPCSPSLRGFIDEVEDRLLACHAKLRKLAASRGAGCLVGATAVVLIAYEGLVVFLWAGDSRLYRYRRGQLQQLTQDHTRVEEMVAAGLITRVEARSHPNANVVTRAVGAGEVLYIDVDAEPLEPGDRFVLCSDGLDKELDDGEIGAILADHAGDNDGDAVEALIHQALSRTGRDNITVVVATAHPTLNGRPPR